LARLSQCMSVSCLDEGLNMLDVAIVGGGLCGLALAHSLQAAKGVSWQLFEAQERLGGRAFTAKAPDGTPVDLGATWFWPDHQPNITRLVADLGLRSLPQVDDGRVLHLSDPNQPPQAVALTPSFQPAPDAQWPATPGAVHGGAMRVAGGVGALIEALAQPLPAQKLHLGHRLIAVTDLGSHIELSLQDGDQVRLVQARRVVLALPPRVVQATVDFTPALDAPLTDTLRDTPTWMATAAKAAHVYQRAFWREAGLTGNAWVTHPQAMLAEVFDASCPANGPDPGAALAGFAALSATQRPAFEKARPLLMESQMVQLFGQHAADPSLLVSQHWQDWAQVDTTCSPLDVQDEQQGMSGHQPYGTISMTTLAEPHWQGRLLFGGSETAARGGGYLEGALGAAARLRKQVLSSLRPPSSAPKLHLHPQSAPEVTP
jgi:monoamine oxidase